MTDRGGLYLKGTWSREPDKLRFSHVELPCLIRRGPLWQWCGYVDLPPKHPWHGKEYDDIDAEVHGGLTYAQSHGRRWRIGFDCAHCWDLLPTDADPRIKAFYAAMKAIGGHATTYKTVAFATAETKRLAVQARTAMVSHTGAKGSQHKS